MAEIPQNDAERKRVRKVGLMMLAAFGAMALLSCCGGGAWVGYAGYNSESAGVRAMYFAALPMGFTLFGLLGAAAGHFLVKQSAVMKVILPVVVGGLGGLMVLTLTFVFFQFIFPGL